MALEFNEIGFNPGRQKAGRRDLMWGRLQLRFTDKETGHNPLIEMTVLLTARPDSTIRELESEATDRAKTILRAALDLLEANNVTSLMDTQPQRDDAEI